MTNEMLIRVAQRLISSWEIEQAVDKGKVMGVLALLGELDKELLSAAGKQPGSEAKAEEKPAVAS